MYRTGHLGVAMLVYAPVGLALLAVGRADLAVAGEVLMLWLAMLPDQDQRVPFLTHRGVTHTVAFALLVGAVLGGVGWLVGGRPDAVAGLWPAASGTPSRAVAAAPLAVFGFAIGTLAVVAHLLGDLLTPAGITPLWPIWDRTVSLDVARADSTIANYALLGVGVFATVSTLLLVAGQLPS